MGKTLIVAEKPSAGKDIAKVVGAIEEHSGYMEGGEYVVTWAVGHLITLKSPPEHDENSHEQNSTNSVFMQVCEAWQPLLSLQIYSNNQLQMV